jgi:hypothetical protein
VRRSSRRETDGLERWSSKTESGLQVCYGKSPGNGAFSMDPIRRRLVRLARAGLTAVSVEPPGAVARCRPGGCAGYEPLRKGNSSGGLDARDLRRDRPLRGSRRRVQTSRTTRWQMVPGLGAGRSCSAGATKR